MIIHIDDFFKDAAHGKLPPVVYLDPDFMKPGDLTQPCIAHGHPLIATFSMSVRAPVVVGAEVVFTSAPTRTTAAPASA